MRRPVTDGVSPAVTRRSVEQRRLTYRGREFHFVSYDGVPANLKRNQPATEPAWWLMNAGTRWEVLPFRPGQTWEELDALFTQWLDAHVFGAPGPTGG